MKYMKAKAVVLRSCWWWCLLRFSAKEHKIASTQLQRPRRSRMLLLRSLLSLWLFKAFFYYFYFFLETAKSFGPVNQDWISDGSSVCPARETWEFLSGGVNWKKNWSNFGFQLIIRVLPENPVIEIPTNPYCGNKEGFFPWNCLVTRRTLSYIKFLFFQICIVIPNVYLKLEYRKPLLNY